MQHLRDSEVIFSKERVPNRELFACLLWEFFRESKTVHELASDWKKLFKSGEQFPDQSSLWQRTSEIKPAINHPLRVEDYVSMVVVQCFGFHDGIKTPWQDLPAATKQKLIENSAANPPVFIGYDLHASAFHSALSDKERTSEDFLVKATAMMPGHEQGKELVLLVVDWARYDDNAIKDGVASLFKNLTRPSGIKPQVRKGSGLGNPNEWRGKLNDLGATRAFAHHAASELKWKHLNIYDFFAAKLTDKGPTAVAKKLAAARRRFEVSFPNVLPFEKTSPVCLSCSRFTK